MDIAVDTRRCHALSFGRFFSCRFCF